MESYLPALAGGLMIGLAVTLLLLLNGRIAGVSGLVAGVLRRPAGPWPVNAAFVAGLLAGAPLFLLAAGHWPAVRIEASSGLLVAAGLLVGYGTRLGSGCTSGHGVAGLARLSPRSLAAVLTFLAAGVATVALQHLVAP